MQGKRVVELVSDDNKEKALMHVTINLGAVSDESSNQVIDGEKVKCIASAFNVKSVMSIFLNNILMATQDSAPPGDVKQWVEEYAKMYMLDALGVKEYPLTKVEGGGLKGFNSDYEVVVESK